MQHPQSARGAEMVRECRAGIPGFAHSTAEEKNQTVFALTREEEEEKNQSKKRTPQAQKHQNNTKKTPNKKVTRLRAKSNKPLASKKYPTPIPPRVE